MNAARRTRCRHPRHTTLKTNDTGPRSRCHRYVTSCQSAGSCAETSLFRQTLASRPVSSVADACDQRRLLEHRLSAGHEPPGPAESRFDDPSFLLPVVHPPMSPIVSPAIGLRDLFRLREPVDDPVDGSPEAFAALLFHLQPAPLAHRGHPSGVYYLLWRFSPRCCWSTVSSASKKVAPSSSAWAW